jgi:uncharacterized damage-inducible protein DinB
MTDTAAKADLQGYLQEARDALLSKLDGLPEYDVRRPLTRTGTNLLGLVKHLAYVELGYLGSVFGRPAAEARVWVEDLDDTPNWDLWATAEESREEIVGFYRRAWEHADATIAPLPLETEGEVPWWRPETRRVTLHRVLVHVLAESQRHVGHADIVRELVDGVAGLQRPGGNLPDVDPDWWVAYCAELERVAAAAQRC